MGPFFVKITKIFWARNASPENFQKIPKHGFIFWAKSLNMGTCFSSKHGLGSRGPGGTPPSKPKSSTPPAGTPVHLGLKEQVKVECLAQGHNMRATQSLNSQPWYHESGALPLSWEWYPSNNHVQYNPRWGVDFNTFHLPGAGNFCPRFSSQTRVTFYTSSKFHLPVKFSARPVFFKFTCLLVPGAQKVTIQPCPQLIYLSLRENTHSLHSSTQPNGDEATTFLF